VLYAPIGIGLGIGGTAVSTAQAYIVFDDPSATATRKGAAILLVLISLYGTRAAFKAHFRPAPTLTEEAVEVPPGTPAPSQQFPPPKPGFVRVYRGVLSGDPNQPQVGVPYRGNPSSAPSGATNFMPQGQATGHAFGQLNPNGLSVSIDLGNAKA